MGGIVTLQIEISNNWNGRDTVMNNYCNFLVRATLNYSFTANLPLIYRY